MENKINIAELLRDCPKGMELDCTIFNNVTFGGIDSGSSYPIEIKIGDKNTVTEWLTEFGEWNTNENSKCVIFPKGKTTWEGFQRPFKDGDIVITTLGNTAIIKEPAAIEYFAHCVLVGAHLHTVPVIVCVERLATEEEKAELFQAVKDNGYRWDEETKKLEKVSQYPQTFEECCTVLGLTELGIIGGYRHGLLTQFRNLLICRDAYWKIADDWKFNFEEKCYYLCNEYHEIQDFNGVCDCNAVLAFPTAEMRDAFYDNFEELIKECKSLL